MNSIVLVWVNELTEIEIELLGLFLNLNSIDVLDCLFFRNWANTCFLFLVDCIGIVVNESPKFRGNFLDNEINVPKKIVYFSWKIGNRSITIIVKCGNILNRRGSESYQNVMNNLELFVVDEFGQIFIDWN